MTQCMSSTTTMMGITLYFLYTTAKIYFHTSETPSEEQTLPQKS